MTSPCVGLCPGQIVWTAGWREWHGSCSTCKGCFLFADPSVEDRDKAVCLLPTGSEWQRLERVA